MICFDLNHRELRVRVAVLEERLAASERERELWRERATDAEARLREQQAEVKQLMDAALQAGGNDPVFQPRSAPPAPETELRPIRRLRDWRREMEFLEAQAFARSQRPEDEAQA